MLGKDHHLPFFPPEMLRLGTSVPGIVTNKPKIIDLFYVGPPKGRFGIINYNSTHRRTYCPLVPKQYTFSATKGSHEFTYWTFSASPYNFLYKHQHLFHFQSCNLLQNFFHQYDQRLFQKNVSYGSINIKESFLAILWLFSVEKWN